MSLLRFTLLLLLVVSALCLAVEGFKKKAPPPRKKAKKSKNKTPPAGAKKAPPSLRPPQPPRSSGQSTGPDGTPSPDLGPIVGGISPANADTKAILTAADEAIKILNAGEEPELKAQLGISGDLRLVQIKSATQQVVAGSRYEIVMTVAGPSANGGGDKSADVHVSVMVQLWMPSPYKLLGAEPA